MPRRREHTVYSPIEFADICFERHHTYVEEASTGRVTVPGQNEPVEIGELEYLAVQRYLNDLKNPAYTVDENEVDRVYQFYAKLRHSKGPYAGRQFLLAPWQCFTRYNIYGFFVEREDEELGETYLGRRFRLAYIQVGKKNGKSTESAGTASFHLIADGESGAEVYCAATKRDQAKIVSREACNMLSASPELSRGLLISKRTAKVNYDAENAVLEPLGADADNSDGVNPSCVVIDELHRHKTRHMYDILSQGMGARENPLMTSITTAGDNPDPENSICYEQRWHAEQVLKGVLHDEEYFFFVAEPAKDMPIDEVSTFRQGNPNLGINVKVSDLKTEARRAMQNRAKENSFRRLKLNQWTEQADRVINMDDWRKCPVGLPKFVGKRCYGGIDLSATNDLSCFALCFPPQEGIKVLTLRVWVYCPADMIERKRQEGRVRYDLWRDSGDLIETPGARIDYDIMLDDIREQNEVNTLVEIGFDQWNSNSTVTACQREGIEMVRMGQNYGTLSAPTKMLVELTLDSTLDHGNNQAFTFAASNLSVDVDSNDNFKPNKKTSAGKIDPMVASIMAIGRYMANPEEDTGSVYENRGLIIIG